MESGEFYDYVSGSTFEYTHNNNLDSIDVSVDRLVCYLLNALDKFCPIIKVQCSRDKDKQKPWLTDENRSLINEKIDFITNILKDLCRSDTNTKLFGIGWIIYKKSCNLLINSQSKCKKNMGGNQLDFEQTKFQTRLH